MRSRDQGARATQVGLIGDRRPRHGPEFFYKALSESTADAQRDLIVDFQKSVDFISLGTVIPGTFWFRSTVGETVTDMADVRLQETVAGSTIVQVDADGAGFSGLEVSLVQVQGMTVDDVAP